MGFSSGGRRKHVSGGMGGVGRRGSGLGTGPVGNSGGYSGRPGGSMGGFGGMGGSGGMRSPGGSRGCGGMGVPGGAGSYPGNSGGGMRGFGTGGGGGFYRGGGNGGGRSGCLTKIIGAILVLLILSWLLRACFGSSSDYGQTQTIQQPLAQTTAAPQNPASSAQNQSSQTQTGSQGSSSSQGGNQTSQMQVLSNNNGVLNTEVRSGSRVKYTDVANAKTATVLVYICGSNLESESGMATSDLQEMIKAGIGENDPVNVIVYTGGASKWKNNVVSRSTNQIYRVLDGGLEKLVADDGDRAMTDPETLSSFITYGVTNYPADRYMLILWDHGAGSVLGYGYDEKHTSRGYMTLATIQDALQAAGVRFDFIGYDACLMATVSNGLMLSEFADYMIASEETEPGTGWDYTGWLSSLNTNPSISTAELGKIIADDYTQASSQYQRQATTTLSVTDLAELKTFLQEPFEAFAVSTSELLNSDSYKVVSDARAGTKEFAATDGLDQVDLVHLALNMGTEEGNSLAQTLQSAVKYNRTSYGYEKAYGLSEYFPWHSESKVDSAIENYDELGLDGEYSTTIRTFANMQLSGQISSGGSSGSYGSLFDSLFGSNGQGYAGYGDYSGYGTYSSPDYNGYYGGYGGAGYYNGNAYSQSGNIDPGTVAELIYLFGRRSTVEGVSGTSKFVDTEQMQNFGSYVAANSINPSHLIWQQTGDHRTLAFDENDWNASEALLLSMFVDDGGGFIDLGLDNVYEFDDENRLIGENDGTWLALNGQIVAYYFLDENADGEEYQVRGYIPALVNEKQSEIYVVFNEESPYGLVTGYRNVYTGDQAGKGDKVISFVNGDVIEPIADYYSYANDGGEVEYQDSYRIGSPITWNGTAEITNLKVDGTLSVAYRITDIYGQHFWTAKIDR